jgi:uncharacterized protein with HEPN domain
MSGHDDQVRLKDMLRYSREAMHLLGDLGRQDLQENRVMQLALTQLVQVVGEAASRVSFATQQQYPQLPWPQIIAMRNRLVHGYDVIDYGLLWDTVTEDLPALLAALGRNVEDT